MKQNQIKSVNQSMNARTVSSNKIMRHRTYSEIFGAAFGHQLIRLWLVLVVQSVQIEARLLQHGVISTVITTSIKALL